MRGFSLVELVVGIFVTMVVVSSAFLLVNMALGTIEDSVEIHSRGESTRNLVNALAHQFSNLTAADTVEWHEVDNEKILIVNSSEFFPVFRRDYPNLTTMLRLEDTENRISFYGTSEDLEGMALGAKIDFLRNSPLLSEFYSGNLIIEFFDPLIYKWAPTPILASQQTLGRIRWEDSDTFYLRSFWSSSRWLTVK